LETLPDDLIAPNTSSMGQNAMSEAFPRPQETEIRQKPSRKNAESGQNVMYCIYSKVSVAAYISESVNDTEGMISVDRIFPTSKARTGAATSRNVEKCLR
jgi:hypothetical protein